MNNKKFKILLLSNRDVCIYNLRLETIIALLDLGYDVTISAPYGVRIEKFKAMGCHFIETKFDNQGTNMKDDLKLIAHYRKIIRQVKPNVILTYVAKPNIYGGIAATKENVPFIANITGLGNALQNDGWVQKIMILLYRFAFKKVYFVFFQNEANVSFFANKKIKHQASQLLPGSGVNLNKFSPMPYPSKNSEIIFLFVARIKKEKGIEHYLQAAKAITAKYANVKFYVCGNCEETYEEMLSEYEKSGVITYFGMIDDIRELLKMTHCTVLPTYHEGLSNVLLESAASARPNIATDVNGCKEVVEDDVTGILIKPKSTAALIEGIEKFLSLSYEKQKEMGEKGRKKIEKEFDRQIVVDAYLEVIASLKR